MILYEAKVVCKQFFIHTQITEWNTNINEFMTVELLFTY